MAEGLEYGRLLYAWLIPFADTENQFVLVGARSRTHAFQMADAIGQVEPPEAWIPVEGFAWDVAFRLELPDGFEPPPLVHMAEVRAPHGLLFDDGPLGNGERVRRLIRSRVGVLGEGAES